MSDIFLSYTSEDRDRLRPLVKVLEDQGWSVFWDRKIHVGQTWREVIGREITDCLSVVVVWSQTAVKSQWVMEEAEEGKRRKILFPVTVDGTTPPFGFGSIQSADFTNWEGDTDHPGYKLLIGDLTRHIQGIKDQQEKEEEERAESGREAEAERNVNAEREMRAKLQAEQSIKEQEEAASQQLAEEVRTPESEARSLNNADKQGGKATESKTAETVNRKPLLLAIAGIAALMSVIAGIYWFIINPTPNDIVSTADVKPINILPTAELKLKDIELTDDMLPEMVSIPSGSFTMGCVSGIDCNEDELPTRKVTVPAFSMSKYEVTFKQWDACHADGGCTHNPSDNGMGRGDRPVIKVSWNDTQQYVEWLSRRTGENYRLPSESEWEYAARAGTETQYWWGDEINQDRMVWANCNGCGSQWDDKRTVPVNSEVFISNPFGLFHTAGNVWEWAQDCYRDDYASAHSDGSAREFGSCPARVLRGGSWYGVPQTLRSADRYWKRLDSWDDNIGFRIARTP